MIYKTESTLPDHVRIVFELPSSLWAHRISVLGEFNSWQGQGEPLHQEWDGHWRAALDLPIDRQYQFHYLVDGQELIDLHADGLSQGNYGEQKSIVSTSILQTQAQHRHPQNVSIQRPPELVEGIGRLQQAQPARSEWLPQNSDSGIQNCRIQKQTQHSQTDKLPMPQR